MNLSEVDFDQIRFPLNVAVIKKQIENGVNHFSQIKSTPPTHDNISQHRVVKDEFVVSKPVREVFTHYVSANPSTAWSGGNLVAFGLGLDKNSGKVFYAGNPYPGAQVGHVLYINLNIWGLKQICMGQEIIEINASAHRIVFSYIEGGKTNGKQVIEFFEQDDQTTHIVHTSFFKGVSEFRDRFLYPYFHSLVVKEFHQNLKNGLIK